MNKQKINKLLKQEGLRIAAPHEAGWNHIVAADQDRVWVTDEPPTLEPFEPSAESPLSSQELKTKAIAFVARTSNGEVAKILTEIGQLLAVDDHHDRRRLLCYLCQFEQVAGPIVEQFESTHGAGSMQPAVRQINRLQAELRDKQAELADLVYQVQDLISRIEIIENGECEQNE